MMSQGFKWGSKWRIISPAYPFLWLIQKFQAATRSTTPDMTTVFHGWLYCRFPEIESNLMRKKLQRTNQGSNFLGVSLSNWDNVIALSNLEQKVNPRILQGDFSSRTGPSIFQIIDFYCLIFLIARFLLEWAMHEAGQIYWMASNIEVLSLYSQAITLQNSNILLLLYNLLMLKILSKYILSKHNSTSGFELAVWNSQFGKCSGSLQMRFCIFPKNWELLKSDTSWILRVVYGISQGYWNKSF